MRRFLTLIVVLCVAHAARAADENLILNGGFEQGFSGWSDFWSRSGNGRAAVDSETRHGGRNAVRIEHTGDKDWSLHQRQPLSVKPGQIYELSGWIRVQGEGDAGLSVTLRGDNDQVREWMFGAANTRATADWRQLRSRLIIPPGAKAILPRLTGNGPATVWLDDVELRLCGSLDALRTPNLPETLAATQGDVEVTLRSADGTFSLLDRRTGRRWTQSAGGSLMVLDAKSAERGLRVKLLEPASMLPLEVAIQIEADRPEVAVEIACSAGILPASKNTAGVAPAPKEPAGGTPVPQDAMPKPLGFPQPFLSAKGTLLIMPVNEGMSYPADDETLRPMHYILYGGHGLCMGWYGATDGEQGLMTIVETPDDAAVRTPRIDGRLCLAPEWEPQRGKFGPARRIRYVLMDRGGYVAMCKRYREHARQVGLLKTLAEKRKANPHVDLLVGAVNVWCWDKDAVGICRELQAAGIQRILWSRGGQGETLRQLNDMQVLTSRYDIYQDTMDPANFPKLRGVHSDWTTEAWPKDLVLRSDGQWLHGWGVKGKDDQWYHCGVLCDRQAVEYARRRIPPELETHPYRCRFIDTTTAAPWHECYQPDHPMTRSESREWKMKLLQYVSEGCKLVAGSETGHEAAVPYVHYFEGMLSLGPYRVADSGRDMQRIWDEVPPQVAKFQTGHYYRLPLWELVYHDCLVAQWYWGDYNNKLPAVWDRRDLINALYGTPPMFMFNRKLWQENRQRFVESYRATCPVARATGYAEMLSHRWLTTDHTVQQSCFANGVTVTVNFGDRPHTLANAQVLAPLAQRVEGLKP